MSARPLRLMVAAFGDAGHAFPAIALGRALAERGHEVVVETWERWRGPVEQLGLQFAAAEQYTVFPPPAFGSEDQSAADAARALAPLLEDWRPDAVVSDILTLAPTLAAEVAGVPSVTLVPHLFPVSEPGMPFFASGMRPPRTPLGGAFWRRAMPLLELGLRQGRSELNSQRERVGLPPTTRFHGGMSERLVLVATFPQLEYPRGWPAAVHVTGPMDFEMPYPDIELPSGEDPLVLVAPSTAKDVGNRLLHASLAGLAGEDVRVVATTNRTEPVEGIAIPPNAVLVDWLSYSQVMPLASLVISHGGHGTLARALGAGAPLLCCPAEGDMIENAIRVSWTGAGLSVPWRLCRPAALRWVARRILRDPRFKQRAEEIGRWRAANDGARRGAELVESFASQ